MHDPRRAHIVELIGQAHALLADAITSGAYEAAHFSGSLRPLAAVRIEYDRTSREILCLFVQGEEEVGFWTAVELYAGFRDPLRYLNESGALLDESGYTLPRAELLAAWAEHEDSGPRYGDHFEAGDTRRHNIVLPNTEAPSDMMLPAIFMPNNSA